MNPAERSTTLPSDPLLRTVLGGVMRDLRKQQRLTLREVAAEARIALGYLSEVERGIKEVSSELVNSIVQALDVPQSVVFKEVAYRMSVSAQLNNPAPPDRATLQELGATR